MTVFHTKIHADMSAIFVYSHYQPRVHPLKLKYFKNVKTSEKQGVISKGVMKLN